MYKYVNGEFIEITAEETSEINKQISIEKAENKYQPLTESELMAMLIKDNAQTLAKDNEVALRMKEYLPTFESICDKPIEKDFKFTYNGDLWQTIQPHTPQEIFPPSQDTAALYMIINEQYAGTFEEPIPYKGNMILESGKYYTQNNEIYECIRDSINPLYDTLEFLSTVEGGEYVRVAK